MQLSESIPGMTRQINGIMENIQKVIVGKEEPIRLLLTALLCRGHVLIEDVPGVGKTMLVNALAKSARLSFSRIQCTPDMLPSDVTGFTMFDVKTGAKTFHPGPVMSQLLLADEINRTSPKTQSSLLEAMDEYQISVDGDTYELPRPFMVMATQNPIECVGTFPLPEAQMDRFLLKISLGYPDAQEEVSMLDRFAVKNPLDTLDTVVTVEEILALQEAVTYITVSDPIRSYIIDLINATRTNEWTRLGASPRAIIALMRASQAAALIRGSDYVRPDDVQLMAQPVLAHRLLISAQGKLQGYTGQQVVDEIIHFTRVPLTV